VSSSTRALLLDIEGTTSSLGFVRDVLFPYARQHLRSFIEQRRGDPGVDAELREVARLAAEQGSSDVEPIACLERWMDQDRKVTPLKALQGSLWDAAFRQGAFVAHLYPEVPAALARFREAGLALYVYSSGSVPAQQAFFRHSVAGDLTPFIAGWFDTNVGSKSEPASYLAIASSIGFAPAAIAFLSDSEAELDAARAAGLSTIGLLREPLALGAHPAVTSFDDLPFAERPRASAPLDAVARAKAQVIELARHCQRQGWAAATSGNFSVRVTAEHIAITASGVDKGSLKPTQVLVIDSNGVALEPGSPSAETPLHTALYGSAMIGAIAHTHSVASTLLSRRLVGRGALRLDGYEMSKALAPARDGAPPELVLPIVENQQDTRALAEAVSRRLQQTPAPAYLVAGHGLTTWGADPTSVLRHVEALEFMLACELAELQVTR
jgi:2,3-diketo-5-methylthio-1-phosphopentane phosphatase/methylthioribulose-1-phosphate dehydratase